VTLHRQFPQLAMKLSLSDNENPNQRSGISSTLAAVNKYIADIQADLTKANAFEFWEHKCLWSHIQLSHLALDLLTSPASQAFVEHLFSVCGIMAVGWRIRMAMSLEICVRLIVLLMTFHQSNVHKVLSIYLELYQLILAASTVMVLLYVNISRSI
jgi:hypothetical protein